MLPYDVDIIKLLSFFIINFLILGKYVFAYKRSISNIYICCNSLKLLSYIIANISSCIIKFPEGNCDIDNASKSLCAI